MTAAHPSNGIADCDRRAKIWRDEWAIDAGTTYLNHGSFGPTPKCVQAELTRWTQQLAGNPMDFYLRRSEAELEDSLRALAAFLGTNRECLVFVDNATTGMNIVASTMALEADDEVLLNDHEYGAVFRIWRRVAQARGARVVTAELPSPLSDPAEVVDAILKRVTKNTRLIVVSQVTSPTAVVLPVELLCQRAAALQVPVCIDGPHAIAMRPMHLGKMNCDFYTASCHKWLSGPLGSGFLYVAPQWQKRLQPSVVSWGGSVGGRQPSWKDEFNWIGTRNPANFLAVRTAIEFLQQPAKVTAVPIDTSGSSKPMTALAEFRHHARELVKYASHRITELTGLPPYVRDIETWCGSMISMPLRADVPVPKPGQRDPLQDRLWERHRIEIPVVHWNGRRFIRVSAHLYNSVQDVDYLVDALAES